MLLICQHCERNNYGKDRLVDTILSASAVVKKILEDYRGVCGLSRLEI